MSEQLESLLKTTAKAFGKNSIRSASEKLPITKIRSGNPAFDYVSCGGFPVNKIIELYGDYSGLKTYHALLAISEFQKVDWSDITQGAIKSVSYKSKKIKLDAKESIEILIPDKVTTTSRKIKNPIVKTTVLIDVEATYDKTWGEYLGVDNEGLMYTIPDSLEEAVNLTETLLEDPSVSLIVFDSMSATGSAAETDADMADHQMAANARFWNKAIRKFRSAINRNPQQHVTLIMINSAYSKVGMVMGDPEQVRNGVDLKLAKSLSVRFHALKQFKEGDKVVGRNISLKCVKNKFGVPFKDCTFYYSFINDGHKRRGKPDTFTTLMDLAVREDIVSRAGAWYEYEGIKSQGFEQFMLDIESNPEIRDALIEKVYKTF